MRMFIQRPKYKKRLNLGMAFTDPPKKQPVKPVDKPKDETKKEKP